MKEFFNLAKEHGIRFTRCALSNRSMFHDEPTHLVTATLLVNEEAKQKLSKLANSRKGKANNFQIQFQREPYGTGGSIRAAVRFDLTAATWQPFASWLKAHFRPQGSVSADPFFLDHAIKNNLRFSQCIFQNVDPSRPAVKQSVELKLSVPKSLVDELEVNHEGLKVSYKPESYDAADAEEPVFVELRGDIAGKRIARFNGWLADHLSGPNQAGKKQ